MIRVGEICDIQNDLTDAMELGVDMEDSLEERNKIIEELEAEKDKNANIL